ncbi:tyrosine-type recombinase/integrase [Kineococcus sp. SYSU DK002]|uniref:tyrosine-type recombinase/integrase n=1 Tax=Kineococcus sp. SYSU DK002 TaxID=3383123 RepID=UPI003D7DB30F
MAPLNPGVLESLTTSSALSTAVDAYEVARLPRKDSPHTLAARARDVAAILPRLARAIGTDDLRVGDLTTAALRAAFADFSLDHARSSIARCWSTWNGLCGFLVAEDVLAGNPMAGVHRPRPEAQSPKPLRGNDTPEILLGAVAAGRQARDPWPERDLAVVATLLVTGIRSSELVGLRVGDLAGTRGDQRIRVRGKGNVDRSLPVEPALGDLVEQYLASRSRRFPTTRGTRGTRLDAPLFVDTTGRQLSRHQLQYLVEQCYRAAGIGDRVQRGALVHALRHTFATRVVAGGASAVEVMRLLGHRSLATSQQYVDAGADELRSAAAASSSYAALRTLIDRS